MLNVFMIFFCLFYSGLAVVDIITIIVAVILARLFSSVSANISLCPKGPHLVLVQLFKDLQVRDFGLVLDARIVGRQTHEIMNEADQDNDSGPGSNIIHERRALHLKKE